MKKIYILFFLLGTSLVSYFIWRADVGIEYQKEYTPLDSTVISLGSATDSSANLVGMQVELSPRDYSSAKAFQQAMYQCLFDANTKGLLNPRSVVVFPEYVGTWLVAIDEKATVYESKTISGALTVAALRHPIDFLRFYLSANGAAADKEALFQLKAKAMAQAYVKTFSELASQFGVTIVAGSIVLPEPIVDNTGALQVKPGSKLYNVSAVFNPDGSLQSQLAKKLFPIEDEKGFVCAGEKDSLPVFDTPAGKLGVLVCADSWYPESYEILKSKGAEIIAVPSFASGNGVWQKLWAGYNGAPPPADVASTDINKLTEREAWLKYALAERAQKAGFRAGINVFLRGQLWDLGSDGQTIVSGKEGAFVTSETATGHITAVYF